MPKDRAELSTDALDQRRQNVRLALILASVALVFFLGFVAKTYWLSGPR